MSMKQKIINRLYVLLILIATNVYSQTKDVKLVEDPRAKSEYDLGAKTAAVNNHRDKFFLSIWSADQCDNLKIVGTSGNKKVVYTIEDVNLTSNSNADWIYLPRGMNYEITVCESSFSLDEDYLNNFHFLTLCLGGGKRILGLSNRPRFNVKLYINTGIVR